MAHNESDREDLYAEATSFVRRVELLRDDGQTVVAGYRRNGVLTIYLSPDEMYQFTPEGELRRALVDDALFRTQGHTLAKLIRHRTPTVTELLRHDLTAEERTTFLTGAGERLRSLLADLQGAVMVVMRHEPADEDVAAELSRSLQMILAAPLRLAPALPTKRK